MAQIGNKQNAILSGEWGKHAQGNRTDGRTRAKRWTAKRRRKFGMHIIAEELHEKRIRLR